MSESNVAPDAHERAAGESSRAGAGVSAYYRLYVALAQKIRDGELRPGDAFYSESEIRADYRLSRVTVRRALDLLEKEGLIVRRQGARACVAGAATGERADRLEGLIENLLTSGYAVEAINLEAAWRAPPPAAAAALRLKPGDDCLIVRRLRRHEEEPFSYSQIFVAPPAASLLPVSELGNEPIQLLLERCGYLASFAEQTLSATLAQDPAASGLGVPIGSALLQLRRTVFNKDEEPFIYQVSLYRPDKYEYHMRLTRESGAAQPQWRHV